MLRKSPLWLAALSVAASIALAPARAWAGGYSGYYSPWHGWSAASRWAYYDGRFVPSGPFGHLHEYAAFNPSCAYVHRVIWTPVGPQRQLVPLCF